MLRLDLKNLYQELGDKTLNENVHEQHKPYYREWAGEMAQPLSKSIAIVETRVLIPAPTLGGSQPTLQFQGT